MDWKEKEKRRFPRANFSCKIVVHTPGIRAFISHTENIGIGGIRVILDEKIPYRDIVDLEIYIEEDAPVRCQGRIVWVIDKINPLNKESFSFDTGVEFIDINSEDSVRVDNLVDKLINAGNSDF